MQTGIMTRFFLSADSRYGYYSLYGSLLAREADAAQYIIKGGHAYGKSVFLERLTQVLLAEGFDAEGFYSTSQREYLDGIYVPKLKTAILDGEPPHAVNALNPGAVETYIDLSPMYEESELRSARDRLVSLTAAQGRARMELYRYLCAAGEIRDNIAAVTRDEKALATIKRRAKGIIAREFSKGSGGTGAVKNRFIGVSSGGGHDVSSVTANCGRVCVIDNDFGLSRELLSELIRGATGLGHDVTAILDPLEPEYLTHLSVPALRLAFISRTTREAYNADTYKHYRLDALPRESLSGEEKSKVKADRKLLTALLCRAGETADEISKLAAETGGIYTAYFDREAAESLADEFAKKLLKQK